MGLGDFVRDRCFHGLRRRAPRHEMTRARHLGADRAQFAHDLAMHGTDIAVCVGGHRYVAAFESFFDTKTSAMTRHEMVPDLHSSSFTHMRFNIGFTPEPLCSMRFAAAHQPLTMRQRRSSKINATGQNHAELASW